MKTPYDNKDKVKGIGNKSGVEMEEGDNSRDTRPEGRGSWGGLRGLMGCPDSGGRTGGCLVDRPPQLPYFLPVLYQVGTAELEPEDIAQPLRKIFWNRPNVRFILGDVQEVDFSAKVVRIPGCNPLRLPGRWPGQPSQFLQHPRCRRICVYLKIGRSGYCAAKSHPELF